MSKIDEMIAKLCRDGVEYKKLEEVCKSGKKGMLKQEELEVNGKYSVVNGGTSFYGRYHDWNNPGKCVTFSSRGENAGHVTYIGEPFWAGALCYPLFSKDPSIVLPEFLYYALKNDERRIKERLISRGGIPALNKADVLKIEIPVPPIEVQREVVRILDIFAELTDELTAKLAEEATARRQQYAHYRDRLLSRESLEAMDGKPVEMLKIQDVCNKICSGGTPSSKVAEYYDGDIPWIRTQDVNYGLIEMPSATISKKGLDNSAAKWIPEGCVIVAMYGATAAKVAMNAIPVTTNQACCNLEVNLEKAFPKYVFHWLASSYEVLKALGEGSQNNISGAKVKNFLIPVPSLATQQKVVDILDRFDALTTSLTNGLPAEIEARRQQYEYYRDKLLSFPRKEES